MFISKQGLGLIRRSIISCWLLASSFVNAHGFDDTLSSLGGAQAKPAETSSVVSDLISLVEHRESAQPKIRRLDPIVQLRKARESQFSSTPSPRQMELMRERSRGIMGMDKVERARFIAMKTYYRKPEPDLGSVYFQNKAH